MKTIKNQVQKILRIKDELNTEFYRIAVHAEVVNEFLAGTIGGKTAENFCQKLIAITGKPVSRLEVGFECDPVLYARFDVGTELTPETLLKIRKMSKADEIDFEGRTLRLWWD